MPTRVRSTALTTSRSYNLSYKTHLCQPFALGGTWGNFSSSNWTSVQLNEKAGSITDTVTDNRSNRRYMAKPCYHWKISNVQQEAFPPIVRQYSWTTKCKLNSYAWEWDYWQWDFSPSTYPNFAYGNYLPSTSVLNSGRSSFGESSKRKLLEAVPTNVLLPAFILELGDLPKIIPQLTEIVGSLGKAARHTNLKTFVKTMAKGHLATQFALLAPIRDTISIMENQRKVMKRLAWLRKNHFKWSSVRVRKVFDIPYSSSLCGYVQLPGIGNTWLVTRQASSWLVTWVLAGQVKFSIPELEGAMATYQALADSFGLNKPWSVAWELLPLSWVLDYFLQLGEYVESLDTSSYLGGSSELRDVTLSSHGETRVSYECDTSQNMSLKSFKLASFNYEVYDRTTTVPTVGTPDTTINTNLSGSQITNLLSLLTVKGL